MAISETTQFPKLLEVILRFTCSSLTHKCCKFWTSDILIFSHCNLIFKTYLSILVCYDFRKTFLTKNSNQSHVSLDNSDSWQERNIPHPQTSQSPLNSSKIRSAIL